ncbi:hypothetical protein I4U23_008029 [Adineta vaga]|nr:hypothetical protein I4U23_008029 [Adineta vaga]
MQMYFTVILGFLINLLLFHQIHTQPTTCVSCMNCQDIYDGTDMNATCSSTTIDATSCQKIRIQFPGSIFVAKACSKSCKEQTIIAGVLRFDIACCTTSYCNRGMRFNPKRFLLLIIIIFLFV